MQMHFVSIFVNFVHTYVQERNGKLQGWSRAKKPQKIHPKGDFSCTIECKVLQKFSDSIRAITVLVHV